MNNWQDSDEWRYKIFNNIKYTLETRTEHLASLADVRLYLRCSQPNHRDCPGRAIMRNGHLRIRIQHSHGAHPGLLNTFIAEDYISIIAGHTLRPILLLQRDLEGTPPCLLASQNPHWTSLRMRQVMNNSRRAMRPPNVHGSLHQLHNILNSEEWHPLLNCGTGRLIENVHVIENNPLVVLYHQNIIDVLATSTDIHIGSSSYKLPEGVVETIIVSVVQNGRLFKCLWFLVSARNRAIYDQIVQITRQKLANVTNVFTNWDLDLITACRNIWPNTHGTWYAYAKAIRQKAADTNIDLIESDRNKVVFRKLVSLALLPSHLIELQFGGIVVALRRNDELMRVFQSLLDYICNVWLNIIGPVEMSCAVIDGNRLEQLRLGWYEMKDDRLLDSNEGIQAQVPSMYQYLEYIIKANEHVLKDLAREDHAGYSIFSPKVIQTTLELRQLQDVGNNLMHGLLPQRALCRFSFFLQVPLYNLLSHHHPLVEGFRVVDAANIEVENIFEDIAAPLVSVPYLFTEENVDRPFPGRIRRAQHQQQQQVDTDDSSDEHDDLHDDIVPDQDNGEIVHNDDIIIVAGGDVGAPAINNDEANDDGIIYDDDIIAALVGDVGEPAGFFHDGLCPICQYEIGRPNCDPRILGCNHVYCHVCIRRWVLKQTNCPVCRCPVPMAIV